MGKEHLSGGVYEKEVEGSRARAGCVYDVWMESRKRTV